MNRIGVILVLLVWGEVSFAQSFGNNVSYFDESEMETVEVDGFGSFGSSALDLETMKLFYRGGFFDDLLKEESLNRLGIKNLFGGEYGMRMAYLNPNVKWLDSAGIYVCYELNGGAGVAFTEDLYRMVFEGNQNYLGDTALFSGTEFSSYAFRKVGFGYNRGNKLRVGVSLMAFDQYSYGIIDRGNYYTDPAGDTVNLRLSGSWMTDNYGSNGTPVGYGIGADFEINLPYENNDSVDIPRMIFGVKNLGLFFSSKQMNVLEIDSLYSYSGVELNNLSDLKNPLFSQQSLGDSLIPDLSQKRKFRVLPFELYFYSTSNPEGKKMQLVYGMRYRFGVSMIPQVYIGGDWRPSEHTIITPFLNFGGYSYIKTGLSIRQEFGKVKVGLAFNNVPGFFTREAYSQSLAISLSYGIK